MLRLSPVQDIHFQTCSQENKPDLQTAKDELLSKILVVILDYRIERSKGTSLLFSAVDVFALTYSDHNLVCIPQEPVLNH